MPTGVTVDGSGDVVIADSWDNCVRVVAGSSGTFLGQPVTAGDISDAAGVCGIGSFSGDGGPAPQAGLWGPTATAFDRAGNLVIADADNYRVRVVAASSGMFYGQAMTAGDIYTVAGSGLAGTAGGDGGPAAAASFDQLDGIAVDGSGNLVVADASPGSTDDGVRVVAATSGTFYGQAMTAGDIYGLGTAFGGARGVAVDGSGNAVLVAGPGIEVLAGSSGTFYGQSMTAGGVYTVAGSSSNQQGPVNGVPALGAALGYANGVALDGQGNLVVSNGDGLIRVVAVSSGTFYGQAMAAGDIYTVAGYPWAGPTTPITFGDGGPATAAFFADPEAVAVDPAGNLYIADTASARIREVTAEPTAQAITFTSAVPTGATVGGASYDVSATGGGSGNPVTFSVDPTATSVCSISGSTVSFTGAGTCVVDADQAGSSGYSAAPEVRQSFAVAG